MGFQRSVYTPSELNREVKLHLEAGFGRVQVEGEISNLSRPASGHLYFSLKDDQAQVRCALFRGNAAGLGFRPENGAQVLASGRVSLYEARGDYQMIVERLAEAGEGRLQAEFEALKKKLEQEGLFDPARKRALPPYPARIAVITSPSGAVIRDILQVLQRRWPLAAVRLYPVPVQGEEAPAAIVHALSSVNRHAWAQAVILARGGGSLEDLQAFNQETVARAVFGSEVPVISAVGHETDFSIADFVADLRAPTPSAAAELLTPDGTALGKAFAAWETQLQRRMQQRLQDLAQRHDHLAQRLSRQHPQRRMREHLALLAQLGQRLAVHGRRLVPDRVLLLARRRERLLNAAGRLVPGRRQRLQELARTLNAVSPLPTLGRGYAIIGTREEDNGSLRARSSVTGISAEQAVEAQLADGRLYCTVERVTAERLAGGEPEES
jgi:exodeoxyribonuclease VII large subunit